MGGWDERLTALEARRTRLAAAPLAPVRTIADRTRGRALRALGNAWSERAFDGAFYETAGGARSSGVVFVRSREGNTGTRDPASLGGGAVDEHLVYEGLSRVAADAVIAGAGTLHPDAFFTVWRPELAALRASLGLPRHPAQVIMSADGSVNPDELLLCNVPSVPVYVLTSPRGRQRLAAALEARPWVTAVVAGSLREQFASLGDAGIRRACSVGGRRSASALVDAGLVRDVYLTTTSVSGGEPGTPWYTGTARLATDAVLTKEWDGEHGPVRFEHLVLTIDGQA
jgi:riboflavin biosynthesis pyrimidine reductase